MGRWRGTGWARALGVAAILAALTAGSVAPAEAGHGPRPHTSAKGAQTVLLYGHPMQRTVHRSRRRRVAVAAVVAAGAATIAVVHGRHHSAPSLPNTYGSIHMVASLEGGHVQLDQQKLQLIAQHDSVVVAQPRKMRRVGSTLKSLNPSLVLVVYENGMYSTPSDPPNLPSSWYLLDSSGARIHAARHPVNTLMNPLSTAPFRFQGTTYRGWAAFVAGRCVADQTPQTTGCYLDMLGISPLNPGWNAGGVMPVNPSNGRPFTPGGFERNDLRVAAATRSVLPSGSFVFANGYSDGTPYTTATNALNGQVNAGEAQTWLSRNALSLTPAEWAADVQMVMSSARAGSSMMVRYQCNCSGSSVDAQREYALATYLLANTGRAFFDFEYNGTKDFESWSPLYDLNLGLPQQTETSVSGYLRGGAYQRAYSGGLVVVNPAGSQVTVRLSRTYRDLSGRQVHSVTLAPRSASILTT